MKTLSHTGINLTDTVCRVRDTDKRRHLQAVRHTQTAPGKNLFWVSNNKTKLFALRIILAALPFLFFADSVFADTNTPIKIVTWIGPWTGRYSSDNNQSKLMTRPNDSHDADIYPSEASINKMKNADVVYVVNHGGVVTTHPIPWPWTSGSDHLIANLDFPDNDDEGPSLVLAWGCSNGDESYKNKKGETVNLLKKYAKGFGIDCNSKTKVYIAPKGSPNMMNSYFQTKFFEEFGKGDVTVEEAARTAAAHWGKQGFLSAPSFEELISICGNRNLTLKQMRVNIGMRNRVPDHSLLFVIDGSGSMRGIKLNHFKNEAKAEIEALDETAEVGLILFNGCGRVSVLSPYLVMTPANKQTILLAIDGINANGDTNIAEATEFACGYQDENSRAPSQTLIIMTDGEETCNGDPVKAAQHLDGQ